MTTRRGFLGLLVAAPVATLPLPSVAEHVRQVFEMKAIAPPIADGVGLIAAAHPSGIMTRDAFSKAFIAGLNEVFSEAYARDQEWEDWYGGDVNEDALEVIEIGLPDRSQA